MAIEMAARVRATASASFRPLLPTPSTSPHTVNTFCKPQFRPASVSLPTSTAISLLALFAPPHEAKALSISKDQIVSSLTEVEKTIDQVQEVGSGFVDTTQRILEVIGNALKPGIETVLPIVQQAGEEALKIASPAISEASKKAQEALQSSGVETEPVLSVAKALLRSASGNGLIAYDKCYIYSPHYGYVENNCAEANSIFLLCSGNLCYVVNYWCEWGTDFGHLNLSPNTVADAAQQTGKVIEDAKPIASTTVETISSADPIVIAGTAGALFLAYLLLPPIWSAISFNLRGYKGELTPAQTLDLLSTQNYIMIDIRSEKDKDKVGVPRLPSSARNKILAIPLEELPSKLRGLFRNVKNVEAEIAALKISYLKKINKGTNIVIMDSYADSAKIVARLLTNLGFKNCWIVADGFSGNRGWLQSRLGTDSYNLSFAEVLSPSRVIRSFGTTS